MKNIPKKIYLCTGLDEVEDTDDFNNLSEITWSTDRINDADIEYISIEEHNERIENEKIIKERGTVNWQDYG